MLNQLFSSGAMVMHLEVTKSNCYWGNLISGSVLNQTFCSGAIVMQLGPAVSHCFWGNLIGAKLIVQWRHVTDHSIIKLNRNGVGPPL